MVKKYKYIKLIQNPKVFKKQSLHYSFKFASIISPGSLKNLTLMNFNTKTPKKNNIYIKQSYILLTWLNYIREVSIKNTKAESSEDEKIPSFFVYPKNRTRLTFLKAPMAHKTFSQEQFLTQTYTMSISFNNNFTKSNSLNTVNSSLFIALQLRNNNLNFESNLIFLKKLQIALSSSDTSYMTL